MKEYIKNNKKLIISHVADVDGISSLLIAKLYYKDIDYYLVETSELEGLLNTIISNKQYEKYNEILITDLSLKKNSIDLIDSNDEFKSKLKHFDHHATAIIDGERYPFVNVVIERDGKKVCGTTLLYDYLKDDFKYKSEYLDKYLEAVRSYDTDGPLCGNEYGVMLTTLFGIIGIDYFINKFSEGIINGKDPITKDDMVLIDLDEERKQEYIDLCDNNMIRINLNGYNVGVSISEQYRSAVGNQLSKRHKDELDYILIIDFKRMQFSFRTYRDDINVGEIAKSFTKEAGGHPKAAGMPINTDTLFILNLVKENFDNKVMSKVKRI